MYIDIVNNKLSGSVDILTLLRSQRLCNGDIEKHKDITNFTHICISVENKIAPTDNSIFFAL